MTDFRISEAAELLGVSDDTVRRWVHEGDIAVRKDSGGRQTLAGVDVAKIAQGLAHSPEDSTGVLRSARNRLVGIVTNVITDTVMAQVELQCGPFRVVSLMSNEAVQETRLKVGDKAVAVVKATMVVVEKDKAPGA